MAILRNSSGKIVRAASGKIRRGEAGESCCCGATYRQARRCDTEALVDVWMTTADAATFPNAFVINAVVDGGCYGLYFDFDGDLISATQGTVYDAADAIAYADCATAEADAVAWRLRIACDSYTVTAHVKVTRWDAIFVDPDFVMDPGSCAGDGTSPPSEVIEEDIEFQVVSGQLDFFAVVHPLTGPGGLPAPIGTAGVMEGDGTIRTSVGAHCTTDQIEFVFLGILPTDYPISIRPREATIVGDYTDIDVCEEGFDDEVYRIEITNIHVECDDAP